MASPARYVLSLDIGSNSVGSMWYDRQTGKIVTGDSVFPAGVDESDDKRGEPKNAKRRMTRRTRITLARRSERKRELRLRLIADGLLPKTEADFQTLLETSAPWELRRKGLTKALTPFELGRVLLHLAQRRGALGLVVIDPEEVGEDGKPLETDDGKVKRAIGEVRAKMLARKARTFGEFIAMVRDERIVPLTGKDQRPEDERKGPREYREAVRNKAASYEHCADRGMIRDEFSRLWDAQKKLGGTTAKLLTDTLRLALDDESGDTKWRHKGLLFGQRRQTWDLGTLGRCVLEPTERCAPHADMHASRYLVVETVNNLKIIERGKEPGGRPLNPAEREKIKAYLSGQLGMLPESKRKDRKSGKVKVIPERPKQTVSVTDLRDKMAEWFGKEIWTHSKKHSPFRFKNEDTDEDREINTDWFSREIVHGSIGLATWTKMDAKLQEGINRAVLRHDPEQEGEAQKLKAGVMKWAGLDAKQADALVAAWSKRPKLDAKRLNMSRCAVLTLLPYMERFNAEKEHWTTQVEARLAHAESLRHEFANVLIEKGIKAKEAMEQADMRPEVRRYATGAKGLSARDRHYLKMHAGDLPPAPMLSNPVVRKAIHEVRRHVVEYLRTFGRKPDEIYIELAREAKMGAKDADRMLAKNRLRSRIRNDITDHFKLGSRTHTQQRAAVDRVVLCVQQGGHCPLCGQKGLTERKAAMGEDCEVAHIIPKASGGHNGLGNIVLAHTKCNRDMGRRTPRQFWESGKGFDAGVQWLTGIYGDVSRPNPSEVKKATGDALWACYFNYRDDSAKIEQFKKDVKDIQQMTNRQEAATKYAARQVMAYLSDSLYEGKGLPERGGQRLIYATDGMWTSRLRREWGLFFDPHHAKAKGLSNSDEHERKEKNRGDHRHHAIDAVVIGHCTREIQIKWEERERKADLAKVNTADEEAMENYRRLHPLDPPAPYKTREEFRAAARAAIFGDEKSEKPVCHRPVKRKLIGAFHKATQYGPVVDRWQQDGKQHERLVPDRVTIVQNILGGDAGDHLKPSHLRAVRTEKPDEAIERLARRLRIGKQGLGEEEAIKAAKKLVKSAAYSPAMVEPKPEKGGIVRDSGLKMLLRRKFEERGLNPDTFTQSELKRSIQSDGPIKHDSGVPIYSVVLLWSNNEPVTIRRDQYDYKTGTRSKDDSPGSLRLYDGQNNHHIEIRAAKDKKDKDVWSGEIVSGFEAAQRKLAKLRALREAHIPKPVEFRKLPETERRKLKPVLRAVEMAHPLVDRIDSAEKGGRFVMSLCEGEMLHMLHKETKEPGYFVVAKLDKPQTVVLVPHWDARAAKGRKDQDGVLVADSVRQSFPATPSDLLALAVPGKPHAVKVRVSPLGVVTEMPND
ncbi:MAG: HNH endonuclease [Phycisphaerales bacterium]|nr:HNH endonuclease [Phycisphaerales bacterium]